MAALSEQPSPTTAGRLEHLGVLDSIRVLAPSGVGAEHEIRCIQGRPFCILETAPSVGFVRADEGPHLGHRRKARHADAPVGGELRCCLTHGHSLRSQPDAVPVVDRNERSISERQVLDAPVEVGHHIRQLDLAEDSASVLGKLVDPLSSRRRCLEVEPWVVRLTPQLIRWPESRPTDVRCRLDGRCRSDEVGEALGHALTHTSAMPVSGIAAAQLLNGGESSSQRSRRNKRCRSRQATGDKTGLHSLNSGETSRRDVPAVHLEHDLPPIDKGEPDHESDP